MCIFHFKTEIMCTSVSRKLHKMKTHVVWWLQYGFDICSKNSKEVLNIASRIYILIYSIWPCCVLCAKFSKVYTVNKIEIK